MGIIIGSTGVNKIYLGSSEMNKIYLGSTVIYEAGPVSFFTFMVNTENVGTSADNQFALPLDPSSTVNCTVNWGDGITNTVTSYDDVNATHTYTTAGEYTIKINGVLNGWRFDRTGDDDKILEISNWGPFDFSIGGSFAGCSVLGIAATDVPTISGQMNESFRDCDNIGMGGLDFTGWDFSVSNNLQYFLRSVKRANPKGLDSIDTSNVTNFYGALQYSGWINQSFAAWNVEKGTIFTYFMNGVSGIESSNYGATLASWGAQNVNTNQTIDFGNSQYTLGSAGETGRNQLIAKGWTIVDGGDTTMSRAVNSAMTDNLDGWSDRNAVWSPKYDGSAYLDFDGSNYSARINQFQQCTPGVTYRMSFDLMENNGCTQVRIYDGSRLSPTGTLTLGTNVAFRRFIEGGSTTGTQFFENNTIGSNIYIKNCTVHEAQHENDIFNTGVISNLNGASATYITGGVNVVSDGTSGTQLRPRILWNSLTIGASYQIDATYSLNSGNVPKWSVYNGSSYEINNITFSDEVIVFVANDTDVFIAWDGQETFDLDAQITLRELIEQPGPFGPELLPSPNFTSGSDGWTLEQTTWSSNDNGSVIMDRAAGSNCRLSTDNIVTESGVNYQLEYTIESISTDTMVLEYDGGSYVALTTAQKQVGTHMIQFTATQADFFRFRINNFGGTLDVTFSYISLKEIIT